jgi:hypothetical protein
MTAAAPDITFVVDRDARSDAFWHECRVRDFVSYLST